MQIEAVTACVNYGDFLAVSAPWNRPLFDRWIVVTHEDDRETRDVCRRFDVQCLLTKDHLRDQDSFNKGRIVERALQHTSQGCWRLHLDADIVLPTSFRRRLESAHLDPASVHGIDRVSVRSYDKWLELLRTGWLLENDGRGMHTTPFPKGFPVMDRWAHPQGGFVPIGFFQLWNAQADEQWGYRQKPYPSAHGTACRTDVQHGLQWDRRLRVLIPEIIGVHLESEAAPVGANWKGRTTKRFGPDAALSTQHTQRIS